MNKEFRVWNPRTKEWLDDCWMYQSGKLDHDTVHSFDLQDCVVQKNTGLTDSTGKKIFEGDIVCEKITPEMDANEDSANVGRVFFAAGTFMIDGDGPLYNHTYSLTPDRLEDYLVIGNIFETPELLK